MALRNQCFDQKGVCALPLYSTIRDKKKHGTLRLYCIRISDNLLIVGGGGIKATRTYEEDEVLSEKVKTLQLIDRELAKLEDNGTDLNKGLYNITLQID